MIKCIHTDKNKYIIRKSSRVIIFSRKRPAANNKWESWAGQAAAYLMRLLIDTVRVESAAVLIIDF